MPITEHPSSFAADTREWLEADGRGGVASGTVNGVRTRRYHGLLLTVEVNALHEDAHFRPGRSAK